MQVIEFLNCVIFNFLKITLKYFIFRFLLAIINFNFIHPSVDV